MKHKKWILKLIFRLMLALVLMLFTLVMLVIISFLCHNKPLRLTTLWDVKACTHKGESLPVKVYKQSKRDAFFVNIVGGPWFAVDFSDDSPYATGDWDKIDVCLAYPMTFPYLCYPDINPYGLDIFHPKLGEKWYLTYMGDTLVFSNKTYFVSMTQENSGRPPVEVHRSTWEKENR